MEFFALVSTSPWPRQFTWAVKDYTSFLRQKILCRHDAWGFFNMGTNWAKSKRQTFCVSLVQYQGSLLPVKLFCLWNSSACEITLSVIVSLLSLTRVISFSNCGCLTIDSPPYTSINKIKDNLASNGIKTERVSNRELKLKYRLNYPVGHQGLLEPTGGMLLASKCLAAVQVLHVAYWRFW
jgi:hypothetical protein